MNIESALSLYLQESNRTLEKLVVKLQQLKRWNQWLREALSSEPLLVTHCCIVGMEKKSLIVMADSTHWVTRFRFFIPELINRLQQHEELKHIAAICCKIQKPHHSPLKKTERVPFVISPNTAKMVKETADKIRHEKLKKALHNLAQRAQSKSTLPSPK